MTTTMGTLPFERPDALAPPPAYAELRAVTPVARVTTPEGEPAWLVTSYDPAVTVLTDPRFGVTPPSGGYPGNHTLFQDGEAHARLRRLVSSVFTPRRIAAMAPRIEQLASAHVATLAAAGSPADLVDLVAAPLSIAVIGELLGVPLDEGGQLRRWADSALLADPTGPDGAQAIEAGWRALTEYAAGLVAAKRENLGDDLLSGLIAVRDTDDGQLSDDELVGMVITLVSSGYLSSCNAISVGTIQAITAALLPSLVEPGLAEPGRAESVVEEILRRQAGVTGEAMPRWAREDVELAGIRIAAHAMVLVRLEAVNRDPVHFADPDRLDPARRPNVHLAFGRGPHHCLGAALARFEVAAVLRSLSEQLPGLQLHGRIEDIPWVHGLADIGPGTLQVRW